MKVSISYFGISAKVDEKLTCFTLSEQSSVKDLVTQFAFNFLYDPDILIGKEGSLHRHLIIHVNKKRVLASKAADHILNDGDEVAIYLSVSGG
ncbi:MAG: MoaD/ThiS family protein [Methanosarcinales archaeon]|nr:MoaD/ThiS family protein [Methanosarcinales archaeon]